MQEGTCLGVAEARVLLTGRAIATSVITAGMQKGPATLLKTVCGDEDLSHTTQRRKDSRRTCLNRQWKVAVRILEGWKL